MFPHAHGDTLIDSDHSLRPHIHVGHSHHHHDGDHDHAHEPSDSGSIHAPLDHDSDAVYLSSGPLHLAVSKDVLATTQLELIGYVAVAESAGACYRDAFRWRDRVQPSNQPPLFLLHAALRL